MDREQRVAGVVGAPQHVLHLERLEPAGDLLRLGFERALQCEIDVGFSFEELVQLAALVHPLAQRVVGLEPPLQGFDFGNGRAGPLGVGPERTVRHLRLQLREARGLPLDVKGSS